MFKMGRCKQLCQILLLIGVLSTLFICVRNEGADEEEVASSAPDVVEVSDDGVKIEDSVLVLTDDNFNNNVNTHDLILVEFYAPWCGHCKKLTPEYAAAAKELAENDPPVVLAKVDATVHADLAQRSAHTIPWVILNSNYQEILNDTGKVRFEVTGYPTLIFFRNGIDYEYDGPRHKDGIVAYMKERAAPDWEPEPDAVITLTKDDFDEVVDNEKLILVEFYAPWCGHCKRLAPIYEKAAKLLKKEDPPILLAKVDATEETELASRFALTGYPTIKLFRNGRASEYKGKRDSEYDFVSFMKRQVGDGAIEIQTVKALKDLLNGRDDIAIVGFFDSQEDTKFPIFKDVADDHRDDYDFGFVVDEAVRKSYKINSGSVVVFNAERYFTKYEPKWHVLEIKDDTTSEDIFAFITSHSLPLVGEYSPPLKQRYQAKKPLCLVFYTVDFGFENREATQFWRRKIASVAKKFPDITFAVADDEENADMLEAAGLGDSGEELNIIIISPDDEKYPMEPMDEYESDDFEEFLEKYKKGKLKPHFKSQRPPKKQTGPVTVVVGSTFEKIVMDSSKDVLIELYAPWCGHCKQLAPKYEALAKKLKKEKNLVIAKMDATANDAPKAYKSTGFPTIFFAPSNNKDKPLQYDGDREVGDFEKYLKEHATVSFGKSSKDEL